MSKLLHAGIRRYARSIVFRLSVLMTAIIGTWTGYVSRQRHSFDSMYVLTELAIMAIVVIWMVGREHEEGIFRNKFIAGYKKGTVYLSELILGIGACLLLFLLYTVIYSAFNSYLLKVLPTNVLVRVFLYFLLINTGVAAAFVTISCLIPRRAITVIVSVLLVIGMAIAGTLVQNALNQPEYWTYIEFDEPHDGISVTQPEGKEYQVENEDYLGGWIRPVAEAVVELNLFRNIDEELDSLTRYMGFESYTKDNGFTYWDSVDSQFSYDEDIDRMYSENLYHAPLMLVIASVLGYCLFRKKEFK